MVTLFTLWPLGALHLLLSIVLLILVLRKRRWRWVVFVVLSTSLMFSGWTLYTSLKPTYRPLYRALAIKWWEFKGDAREFKNRKVLDVRKLIEQTRNPDHALLCSSLEYPLNLDGLRQALSAKPELSSSCALIEGRQAVPLVALLSESLDPWRHQDEVTKRKQISKIRQAAKLLLDGGADPDLADDQGNTPLHWALWYRDEELINLLLENGACVYLENDEGVNILHSRSTGEIRKILRKAAQDPQMTRNCPEIFQLEPADKEQQSATSRDEVLRAVRSWNLVRLTRAVKGGADPNIRDRDGRTPLHLAASCRKEAPAMVEILLEAGAEINAIDRRGQTPLITAARNHCPQIVSALLEKGADVTLAAKDGATLLHWAARWSAEKLAANLDQILAAGIDIDVRDKYSRTPLMMTRFAPMDVVNALPVLLDHGASIDAVDQNGDSLLHQLASDSSKHQPLQMLAELLKRGAALEKENAQGMTPLALAVTGRKLQSARMLLEAGASPNITIKGTPLLHKVISCQKDKLSLLELLLSHGVDVQGVDSQGRTALHRAMLNQLYVTCNKPLDFLLTAGANPNVKDHYGQAPLHSISHWVKKDAANAVRLMLNAGAELEIRDEEGRTPLLRTARFGQGTAVMKALLDVGANPKVTDQHGNTLLHNIAMNINNGSLEQAKLAISSGAELKSKNKAGKTALDLAKKNGLTEVANYLVGHGGN